MTEPRTRIAVIRKRADDWASEFATAAPEGPLEEDLAQATEDLLYLLAKNERLREALKSIADASASDTTFETARRIARMALASNSEAGNTNTSPEPAE